eukprot:3212696-Rhodomonas_salina.1
MATKWNRDSAAADGGAKTCERTAGQLALESAVDKEGEEGARRQHRHASLTPSMLWTCGRNRGKRCRFG